MSCDHAEDLYENFHQFSVLQKRVIKQNNFTYRNLIKILEVYNKNIENKKILDIGCGVGTVCFYLSERTDSVLGIDVSKNAISVARKNASLLKLKNINFLVMDFPNELPLGKFDFIICSEVLEHLRDDNLALKRILLLLKNRGIAVISVPSKNAPLFKIGLTKDFDRQVGHLRRYQMEDLSKKCKNLGFIILGLKRREGIIRNFLFINPIAGKLVKFIRFYLSDILTFIDEVSVKLFGESNIFIILQKP